MAAPYHDDADPHRQSAEHDERERYQVVEHAGIEGDEHHPREREHETGQRHSPTPFLEKDGREQGRERDVQLRADGHGRDAGRELEADEHEREVKNADDHGEPHQLPHAPGLEAHEGGHRKRHDSEPQRGEEQRRKMIDADLARHDVDGKDDVDEDREPDVSGLHGAGPRPAVAAAVRARRTTAI